MTAHYKNTWIIAFMAIGALSLGAEGFQNHSVCDAIGAGLVGIAFGFLAGVTVEIGLPLVVAVIANLG